MLSPGAVRWPPPTRNWHCRIGLVRKPGSPYVYVCSMKPGTLYTPGGPFGGYLYRVTDDGMIEAIHWPAGVVKPVTRPVAPYIGIIVDPASLETRPHTITWKSR